MAKTTAAPQWPIASDFNCALQNPAWGFKNAALKQCTVEINPATKLPHPRAGQFACVFKATLPNGRDNQAVRVFTSAAPERRERYQEIDTYLKAYLPTQPIKSLVAFEYSDDGIKSKNGKSYPLLTMDWVRGEQLYTWVNERCDNKDSRSLERAADQWCDTIKELNAAQIAHGDLQHGNVMVTDKNELKLVDYDCMCVPKLVGKKNLEIGVDPYQHPARNLDTLLHPNLDNFSALFIFVALQALAASPGLWLTYVKKENYEKLLFKRGDLHDPVNSDLIKELRKSPCKDVQRLTGDLIDLTQQGKSLKGDEAQADIERVPRLEDLLFSFGSVETLLNQRDFDGALALLTRSKKQVKDAPPLLQPRLLDAQQRVDCRQELEKAVNSGDERGMQLAYRPKLLDDYPQAQPLVSVAKQAAQVLPILDRLEAASQKKQWREFVREWDSHQSLLAARKSAARLAPLASTWRDRNQACDAVLNLLKSPDGDGAPLVVAWDRLTHLGGHPDADAQHSQIKRLLDRHTAWTIFAAIPRKAEENWDLKLRDAWNDLLFKGWKQAEDQRGLVDQAKQRLEIVDQLRNLAARPLAIDVEKNLVQVATPLAGYQFELQARIEQARQRIDALLKLQVVLREPASDLAIVATVQTLDGVGGRGLATLDEQQRITLAEQRSPLLNAIKTIPPAYPASQAPQWDDKLLAQWKGHLLDECPDARPWLPSYQLAVRRKSVLDELRGAVAANDKMRVADLMGEECLQDYPLAQDLQRQTRAALAEVQSIRELVAVLSQGDPARLLAVFDARVIRQSDAALASYRPKLLEWMKTEILPSHKLGLLSPLTHEKLTREQADGKLYRARWRWPEPRFCDECIVLVLRSMPRRGEDLRSVTPQVHMKLNRKLWQDADGCHLIRVRDEWVDSFAIVCAIVNLGFDKLYSEPLVLGKLAAPQAATSKRRSSR